MFITTRTYTQQQGKPIMLYNEQQSDAEDTYIVYYIYLRVKRAGKDCQIVGWILKRVTRTAVMCRYRYCRACGRPDYTVLVRAHLPGDSCRCRGSTWQRRGRRCISGGLLTATSSPPTRTLSTGSQRSTSLASPFAPLWQMVTSYQPHARSAEAHSMSMLLLDFRSRPMSSSIFGRHTQHRQMCRKGRPGPAAARDDLGGCEMACLLW